MNASVMASQHIDAGFQSESADHSAVSILKNLLLKHLPVLHFKSTKMFNLKLTPLIKFSTLNNQYVPYY